MAYIYAMHFTDKAIILSVRKHAETSAIVRVLMAGHGLCAGVVRGVSGKTSRGLYQPGNMALLTWTARLSEHIGTFRGELTESIAAHAMQDAGMLAALSSACTLTESLLPERAPYVLLYQALQELAFALKTGEGWEAAYCRFELELLSSCGFRLDLSTCAATGVTQELVYVSPKSGHAVSARAGEAYKDKLFRLPAFLRGPYDVKDAEILASLRLTGYFLHLWLLTPHGKNFPAARTRLVQELVKHGEVVG